MFNEAFSRAGPACTIATVEALTKIRIDNYVVVDFTGFKDMVDALHGVKVCLPYAVDDPQSHLNLSAGTHTVRGQQALAYVRTRHGLGNGSDLSRIDRQQAFIGSMVSKVKSKGILLNPVRLYNFLAAATNSLTTDFGSIKAMAGLAKDLRTLPTKDVTFLTAPNEPWTQDPNRVQLKASAATVWRSLRFDQPLPGKEPKPTSSPSSTSTPSGPPLVTAPEKISVTVLNGSGVKGAASDLAAELTADGFNVIGVGNADRTYTQTTVLHDPAYDESGRTAGCRHHRVAGPGGHQPGQHADGRRRHRLPHRGPGRGQRLDQQPGADRDPGHPHGRPEHLLVAPPAGLGSAPAGNVARRERRCAGWMARRRSPA